MTIIEKVITHAYWTSYDPGLREEPYWYVVGYEHNKIKFKRKKLAAPGDFYFEEFNRYVMLYSKEDHLISMLLKDNLEPIAVVGKKGEGFRLGDFLFNGSPIAALKIVGRELYINGETFTSLKKKLIDTQKS